MSKTETALKLALQLISSLRTHSWTVADEQLVITAIREALAERPRSDYRDWDFQDLQDKDPELVEQPAQQAWNYKETGRNGVYTPVQPAQPAPVAQVHEDPETGKPYVQWMMPLSLFADGTKFYTSQPQRRQWAGLTDAEFQFIYDKGNTPAGMMEMVEEKLKEKNS